MGGLALEIARFAVRGASDIVDQLTGTSNGAEPHRNGAAPEARAASNGDTPSVEPAPQPQPEPYPAPEPEPAPEPAPGPAPAADRSIFDSAHDAFVAMDADDTITAWNPAAEATFGWTVSEAIGRTVAETVFPPEHREAHRAAIAQYMRSGEASALGVRLDLTALHRDGHTFPVEVTISAVEDGGSGPSFYAFMHEISDRKQAEGYRGAQLAVGSVLAGASSLEHAMPVLLQAVGEGCGFQAAAFWSQEGGAGALRCGTFWSSSEQTTRLEAETRELELAPGEDLPGVALADRTATWVRKVAYDRDFSRAAAASDAGLESALAAPLVREDKVFGVIELLTTEQQPPKPESLDALAVINSQIAEFAARGQAERDADRVKDEFFALVSHELRTPLTSIIGYTDMLAKTEAERLSDRGSQMIEVIRRNAGREMRLVGDLLMLVRIEAGRFELEPGTVDLGSVVQASIEASRPAAEKGGLTLTLEAEQVPEFSGDPERVGQAVDNLLSNAIKFTEEGGVTVKVFEQDGQAVVEVVDTGAGIPDDDLARLFDRLYRAASATAGHVPGTGLGLTIVKGIVEAHGGRVLVESEVGAGTSFRIEMPLEPVEASEQPEREPVA